MTTEQVKKPQTLTELFNLAKENLKSKGIDRPAPASSNYQASSQLHRKLLDSIFMEPRYLDPVEPDTGTSLFGVKKKTPAFCSALSKPGHFSDEEMVDLVRGVGKDGSPISIIYCVEHDFSWRRKDYDGRQPGQGATGARRLEMQRRKYRS